MWSGRSSGAYTMGCRLGQRGWRWQLGHAHAREPRVSLWEVEGCCSAGTHLRAWGEGGGGRCKGGRAVGVRCVAAALQVLAACGVRRSHTALGGHGGARSSAACARRVELHLPPRGPDRSMPTQGWRCARGPCGGAATAARSQFTRALAAPARRCFARCRCRGAAVPAR